MATTTYTARDGETVDYIAWKYYGSTDNGQVEAVLDANKGLSDTPVLTGGTVVILPDIDVAAAETGVRLWD